MIRSLPPQTLTSAPFSVDLNSLLKGTSGQVLCEVLLQNQSPFPLLIEIAGNSHLLTAELANVYPLCEASVIHVVPQAVVPAGSSSTNLQGAAGARLIASATATAAAQPSGSYALLVTVATAGDHIPGTFPAALAAEIQLGENPAVVTTAVGGVTVVPVPDTTPFYIGCLVEFFTSSGIYFAGPATVSAVNPGVSITVPAGILPSAPASGSVVIRLPRVGVDATVAGLWQAPTQTVFKDSGVGATATLLAGVASQTIRVWGGQLSVLAIGAGTFAVLADSNNNQLVTLPADAKGVVAFNLGGAPLGLGLGLVVTGTGAANGRASAAVSQG